MKINKYIVLNVILSAILLTFGLLIEFKGTNSADGTASALFVVPAVVLLSSNIINSITLKNELYYAAVYGAIFTVGEIIVYFVFSMGSLTVGKIMLFLIVMFITVLLCILFKLINEYENKKPRIF